MILEKIDQDLLKMAEESDSVLQRSISASMRSVYIIQTGSYLRSSKIRFLILILQTSMVMETMMRAVIRSNGSLRRCWAVRMPWCARRS